MNQLFSLFIVLLSDGNTSDLAAHSLWKLVYKVYHSWILIRRRLLFYKLLKLLFQLFGRCKALPEDNRSFYYLSSDSIRNGGDGAFQNRRMLEEYALYLKRPYAVARRFDEIISPSNIPVISILVLPRRIACVIQSVMPRFFCIFL